MTQGPYLLALLEDGAGLWIQTGSAPNQDEQSHCFEAGHSQRSRRLWRDSLKAAYVYSPDER